MIKLIVLLLFVTLCHSPFNEHPRMFFWWQAHIFIYIDMLMFFFYFFVFKCKWYLGHIIMILAEFVEVTLPTILCLTVFGTLNLSLNK